MSDSDRSGPDEDELEHVPFPKMADTTAEWTIPRKYAKLFGANAPAKSSGGGKRRAAKPLGLKDLARAKPTDWLVMEKVPGANFCFVVDANGGERRFAILARIAH